VGLTAAAHKGKQEANWPTKFGASWVESSSPPKLDNDELKLKPAGLIDMQCTCRRLEVDVLMDQPPAHSNIPHSASRIHLPQGTQDTPVIGKYVAGMLQTFAAIVD